MKNTLILVFSPNLLAFTVIVVYLLSVQWCKWWLGHCELLVR